MLNRRRKIRRALPAKRITIAPSVEKLRGTGFEVVEMGGSTMYFYNGLPHRKDGPAMVFPGCESWYFNGKVVPAWQKSQVGCHMLDI